jgi:ABC-type nitrate/sulfonate/bicarbonate transport system substrate-binding protein
VENGTPVAYFCGSANVLQTTLIAKKGSSLPSTADGASWQQVLQALKGKKVGVQTPIGSGLQLLFAAALKQAGVTDVTYVNVGGGNNLTLAALSRGSVDVAQVNPPATQGLTGQVKELLYLPDGPPAYKLYGSAWTGQASWLKDHPTAAKGFCNAIAEAVAYIKNPANLASSAKALATDTQLPATVATEVVKTAYGPFSTDLPKNSLMATFKFYQQIGITKTDMSTKYDTLVQPVSG